MDVSTHRHSLLLIKTVTTKRLVSISVFLKQSSRVIVESGIVSDCGRLDRSKRGRAKGRWKIGATFCAQRISRSAPFVDLKAVVSGLSSGHGKYAIYIFTQQTFTKDRDRYCEQQRFHATTAKIQKFLHVTSKFKSDSSSVNIKVHLH